MYIVFLVQKEIKIMAAFPPLVQDYFVCDIFSMQVNGNCLIGPFDWDFLTLLYGEANCRQFTLF